MALGPRQFINFFFCYLNGGLEHQAFDRIQRRKIQEQQKNKYAQSVSPNDKYYFKKQWGRNVLCFCWVFTNLIYLYSELPSGYEFLISIWLIELIADCSILYWLNLFNNSNRVYLFLKKIKKLNKKQVFAIIYLLFFFVCV